MLTRAAGVPMPGDSVFDAVERLHAELDEVRDLLSGPDASVRLVLTPEAVVLAEARRSWTTLSLFGYRVDGVVANRVFPGEGADDWRAGWVMSQDAVLDEVAASFDGLRVWRSLYRPEEPVGVAALSGSPPTCTPATTPSRGCRRRAVPGAPGGPRRCSTSRSRSSAAPTSISLVTATSS